MPAPQATDNTATKNRGTQHRINLDAVSSASDAITGASAKPSSTAPPAQFPSAVNPGPVEMVDEPSFRVRIVAHASPRWRASTNAADADRRNLELSKKRMDAVLFEVRRLFAQYFPQGKSVDIKATVQEEPSTIGTEAQARGSRDTLKEAKGNRADDAQERRRVDVIIKSSQIFSGQIEFNQPKHMRYTATQNWQVNVQLSAGVSLGAALQLINIELTNLSSKQTLKGRVWLFGGATPDFPSVNQSIWSDPSTFHTRQPVNFRDFDGVLVRYTSVGFNAFLGYEEAVISFIDTKTLGKGAQGIRVSGFNLGGPPGLPGGGVVSGKLKLQGPFPPEFVNINPDKKVEPYERNERGEYVHRVEFPTEGSVLSQLERTLLDSFIQSVVESQK